jgi:hypothetical protein
MSEHTNPIVSQLNILSQFLQEQPSSRRVNEALGALVEVISYIRKIDEGLASVAANSKSQAELIRQLVEIQKKANLRQEELHNSLVQYFEGMLNQSSDEPTADSQS